MPNFRPIQQLMLGLAVLWLVTEPVSASWDEADYPEARTLYQQAVKSLEAGQTRQFQNIRDQLEGYPLAAYLDYYQLLGNLNRASDEEIKTFFSQYDDSPMADRLRSNLLDRLAKKGQWERYLSYYPTDSSSTEDLCHALWAMHKTGKTEEALNQVEPLWLSGHSQPDACDPILELWRDQGRLTADLAWQRFTLAIGAGQTTLAKYLIRFVDESQQDLAKLYRRLYLYPAELADHPKLLSQPGLRETDILVKTLERLASRDPELASDLRIDYRQIHAFSEADDQRINKKVILGYARQGLADDYKKALSLYPYPSDDEILEAGAELAVERQDWGEVARLISAMSAPTRELDRWTYWYARSLQEQPELKQLPTSHRLYQTVAENRSYYGFLAADLLHQDYALRDNSYAIDGNFLEQFKRMPAIVRARELYLIGDDLNARREWYRMGLKFTNDQHYAAAHYAYELGWYSQAIKSAIAAERWDDLKLRFPLAYESVINQYANQNAIDTNWALAIARQESAMTPDAQSPKGAMGLMQIMPATGKQIARDANLKYRGDSALLEAEVSAQLGSFYLSSLKRQFEDNAIYATAAYNAGPSRVRSWLKASDRPMPMDVWIESIPFSETRQYVKNVLTYSVIFSRKRQESQLRMATYPYLKSKSDELAQLTLSNLPTVSE